MVASISKGGQFEVGSGFPVRFEEVMARKRLSLNKIYKETGIARETLRRWRNGYTYPNRLLMYRLCQAYEIDMNYLIRHEGEPPLRLGSRAHAKLKFVRQSLNGVREEIKNMNGVQLQELGSILLKTRREIRLERERRKATRKKKT